MISEIDRMLIERACERLIMAYALAVNDWDLAAFVSLFAPDGEWQRPAFPLMRGHAEIAAFMASQPVNRTLRHVNGGCLVTVEGPELARAVSQTTVYETPGWTTVPAPLTGPDMVVEYRDVIRLVDGQWRFARRDTTIVFWASVKMNGEGE